MQDYQEIIKKRLSKARYEHSLGVAETARDLALFNQIDPFKAYLTGILHDYAKELTNQELIELGKSYNLISDEVELYEPELLHGPVGAVLIREELGINDIEILNAIRYHTTGCKEMDKLSQIIYIADYIEPNRKFPGVDCIRDTAYTDLTKGVLLGLNSTIRYLLEIEQPLHKLTIEARNGLLLKQCNSEKVKMSRP
ncbi:MAG: bis(5'-nucleosyl)-tetraphosphatase (symmetrical) YqeK [Peptococcales bacterium]|jgi:predicted HD superfamily hydrolase involved in NAD metabolism